MVISSLRPDASFVDFLESQARKEPVSHLWYRAFAAFVLVLVGFGPVAGGRLVLVTASFAYFSYAMWGLLDRGRSESVESGRGLMSECLRVLCAFFVAIGVVSGIGLLMAIGFMLLGSPWIL